MKKKCPACKDIKSFNKFYNEKIAKDGKHYYCKICDDIRNRKYYLKYPEKYLFARAKWRAKKKGIPFDLKLGDIKIPKVCPVFKKPFVYGIGKVNYSSMSLDRIENTKGYTKDNIIVVSFKANTMKSNATVKELRILTNFYEKLMEKK